MRASGCCLMVGFLGGFTTFSSFENEAYLLLRGGSLAAGLADILLHVVAGLVAVWLGYIAAEAIWR